MMTGWDLSSGLRGRGVIVTGAGSGIGRATAAALADAGALVAAVDRDPDGLDQTMSALAGGGHRAFQFDLADVGGIGELVTEAASALGDLWALVHVAAVLRRQQMADVTEEDFDLQTTVNLKATFFLDRAVGDVLIAAGSGGRIVNFTSAAFLTGAIYGSDAYVATKGGVVTMTRSFAKQLGPFGITANVISPGQIDTPMQHVDNSPEVVQAAIEACPLRRIGQPEEVAAAAVFLVSRHASFVNGATLTVSGGSVMH